MKRICALLFALCMLVSCAYASVETEERRTPLSNKTLVKILENNGYKGWTLYQPGPCETETNTSSKTFLRRVSIYPIVAEKDGETHLVILRKKGKDWKFQLASDKAVSRDGFRMYDFSMDENISSESKTLYIWFDYADGQDRRYTLELDLSDTYNSYFRYLELPGEDTDDGRIYRTIIMNYLRDFDFELSYYGGSFRETIGVQPWKTHEFGIEEFSLAEMPLSLADLTKQAVVKNAPDGAPLYRRPSETGEPIAVLHEGDTANIVRLEYSDSWMIVCMQDDVYYARSAVFE